MKRDRNAQVFESTAEHRYADFVETPLGSEPVESSENERCKTTNCEPVQHGRVHRIGKQSLGSDESEADTLIVQRNDSLSSPLVVGIVEFASENGSFRIANPQNGGVVDGNANEDTPDLGNESGTWGYMEVMAEFHVTQHGLCFVPALARDGSVTEGTDGVARSTSINGVTVEELVEVSNLHLVARDSIDVSIFARGNQLFF